LTTGHRAVVQKSEQRRGSGIHILFRHVIKNAIAPSRRLTFG
jgi:hypothetical protein